MLSDFQDQSVSNSLTSRALRIEGISPLNWTSAMAPITCEICPFLSVRMSDYGWVFACLTVYCLGDTGFFYLAKL